MLRQIISSKRKYGKKIRRCKGPKNTPPHDSSAGEIMKARYKYDKKLEPENINEIPGLEILKEKKSNDK
jgi:hypothetical protein